MKAVAGISVDKKSILSMFKINLENFFKAKLALYYHLRMQPSEIENMPYYEYEMTLENLQELLKEKHDAEKGANKSQQDSIPNYSKMAGKFKSPKMPNIKIPKM